jgi:hypothetical protein
MSRRGKTGDVVWTFGHSAGRASSTSRASFPATTRPAWNPGLLDKVQPGSKVRFAAEKSDGSLVVTG